MRKIYAFLLLIVFLLDGCSSDNESSPLLVKEITTTTSDGNTSSTKCFYNGNKLSYYTVGDVMKIEFEYIGENNDLIGVAKTYQGEEWISSVLYYYDGDGELFKEIVAYNDNYEIIKHYTYNSDNTVTISFYDGNDLPSQLYQTSKIYFDANHRFVKMADWDGMNWVTKVEATYTNYNSPLKNITGYNRLITLLDVTNGFASYTQYDSAGVLINSSLFEYTLNAYNYPTQRAQTLTNADGTTTITTSNYTYY